MIVFLQQSALDEKKKKGEEKKRKKENTKHTYAHKDKHRKRIEEIFSTAADAAAVYGRGVTASKFRVLRGGEYGGW